MDFLKKLVALYKARSPESYKEWMDFALDNLDDLEKAFKIQTEDDYVLANSIKGLLCSLSCTTFNTKHPDNDQVWRIESIYGSLMVGYNKKNLLKNRSDILVANYLIGKTTYVGINFNHVLNYAKERNFIRQSNGRLYVIGLLKKVGDNVFSIDRRGRQHRQYVDTIGRQYFAVPSCRYNPTKEFFDGIPMLDEKTYYEGFFADHKGGSKYPALCAFQDLNNILKSFSSDRTKAA